jgi:hypothetical protein
VKKYNKCSVCNADVKSDYWGLLGHIYPDDVVVCADCLEIE